MLKDFDFETSNEEEFAHHKLPSRMGLKVVTSQKGAKIFVRSIESLSKLPSSGISTRLLSTTSGRLQFGFNGCELGPGAYSVEMPRKDSHGYIAKERTYSAKKLKPCLIPAAGPGQYEVTTNGNFSSSHKASRNLRFSQAELRRLISHQPHYSIPPKSDQAENRSRQPGPGFYHTEKALSKVSQYPSQIAHSISRTSRTSLVNLNHVPGPGTYAEERNLEYGKPIQKKPRIQFKFVYGHPS